MHNLVKVTYSEVVKLRSAENRRRTRTLANIREVSISSTFKHTFFWKSIERKQENLERNKSVCYAYHNPNVFIHFKLTGSQTK